MTSKKTFLSYKLFYSELFTRFTYYLSKLKKEIKQKKKK